MSEPITTLPLSQITYDLENPRKSFNEESIASLAQSIKTDGLLQNIVVHEPIGRKKKYIIICGERRFRALSLLQKNGDIPQDYEVKVYIKSSLSREQRQRMAVIENIQREDLSPIEEAEAVAALLQEGASVEEVSAKTGFSTKLIRRRLKLANLCSEVKEALSQENISISQAEALTLGSHEQQKELLDYALDERNPNWLRNQLSQTKANVAMALFDKDLYTGSYTADLFAEEENTYFDDLEQFMTLQKEVIAQKVNEFKEAGYDPVEVMDFYDYESWKYRPVTEEDESLGGVIIRFSSCGQAEILKNLIHRDLDKSVDNDLSEPVQNKPLYSTPLIRNLSMHKSLAVQRKLLEHPRIAKETAITQLLLASGLKAHGALAFFKNDQYPPNDWETIESKATELALLLGNDLWTKDGISEDEHLCDIFIHYSSEPVSWYEALKKLSDSQLDDLHLFITSLTFGQLYPDQPDTHKTSLFNRVAKDLKVDMKEHWRPDEEFLKRRNKEQLATLIKEAGADNTLGEGQGYKKSELVTKLADYFRTVQSVKKPNRNQKKALNYLPEIMNFPAKEIPTAE